MQVKNIFGIDPNGFKIKPLCFGSFLVITHHNNIPYEVPLHYMIGDSYYQDDADFGKNFISICLPDPLNNHKPTEYRGPLDWLKNSVNVDCKICNVVFAFDADGKMQMYNNDL